MDNKAEKSSEEIARRVAALDWGALRAALDEDGHAVTPPLLTPEECGVLAALEDDDARFRTRVEMEHYRFGRGRYGYFSHPLPSLVRALQMQLYAQLAPIANAWAERLGLEARYPRDLAEYLARCAARGQARPTPLLLRYEAGGFNCLHQDRYGAEFFPIQATGFLSRPGVDYTGGEFLLLEQRPRRQSRGTALSPGQGRFLLFPGLYRPVPGRRGWQRAAMRHGVSTVTSGTRFALGIIFHGAV
jgi:hypothetical protein